MYMHYLTAPQRFRLSMLTIAYHGRLIRSYIAHLSPQFWTLAAWTSQVYYLYTINSVFVRTTPSGEDKRSLPQSDRYTSTHGASKNTFSKNNNDINIIFISTLVVNSSTLLFVLMAVFVLML